MVIGVKPHCFGMRPENEKFLDQHIARSRETSLYGVREHEDRAIKEKDLR
jgi:hypothetical protein